MLGFVKEAFEHEKQKQEDLGLHCEVTIDGYTDFIFINRFGQAQHQATLNKAIRRIIRDCNDEQFLHSDEPDVLLPHFSCHSLRHTFTTRMCEAGVNIKVIQDALGHSDISTTLNIYADVTKEMKAAEFKGLDSYFIATAFTSLCSVVIIYKSMININHSTFHINITPSQSGHFSHTKSSSYHYCKDWIPVFIYRVGFQEIQK